MRPSLQPLEQPLAVDGLTPEHASILESRSLDWPDESACAAFAARLAARPALHDAFIELRGPLGAGKTTFARHLLRALGVGGRVKSPSYAVMETYRVGALEVSHLDFYRFEHAREWDDRGLREVFAAPGLKLVEWPDRAAGRLPLPDLRLQIEPVDESARRVTASALTPRGWDLLA